MILNCNVVMGNETISNVLMLTHTLKNGDHICMTCKDLVSKPELLDFASSIGYTLKVSSVDGCDYPALVCTSGISANITSVVNKIKDAISTGSYSNIKDSLLSKISDLVNKRVEPGSEDAFCNIEDLEDLVNFLPMFDKFFRGEEKWLFDVDSKYLTGFNIKDILKNYRKVNKVLESFCTETLFMESPDSKLSIALPTYTEIANPFFNPSSYIPNIAQVFRVYDKKELFSVNYASVLETSNVPLDWIVGNSDNNSLPIQDNEKDFYNALCELMDVAVSAEHPDMSYEDLKTKNICSEKVRNFYFQLLFAALSWNFSHSPYIKISSNLGLSALSDIDSEERDSNEYNENNEYNEKEESKDYIDSNSMFQIRSDMIFADGAVATGNNNINSEYVLRDFILQCCTYNKYSICEAIVKTLRWGFRKCSRIKIECTGQYFDPVECTIGKRSDSYSDTAITLSEGKRYSVVGLIYDYERILDTSFLKVNNCPTANLDVPVGYVLYTPYNDGNEIYSYISAFEFESIVDKVELPEDEDEMARIYLNKVISRASSTSTSNDIHKFVHSIEYISIYESFKCFSKLRSVLSIIDEFTHKSNLSQLTEFDCFTKEDILDKIRSGASPSMCLDLYVANIYVPVVLKVMQEFETKEDCSFKECRDIYKRAMNSLNVPDRLVLESESKTKVESKIDSINDSINSLMKSNSKLKDSTVFSNESNETSDEVQESVKDSIKEETVIDNTNSNGGINPLIHEVDYSLDYYNVVNSEKKCVLFAGIDKTGGKNKYYLCERNNFRGNVLGNAQLRSFTKMSYNSLANCIVGDYEGIKLFYENTDLIVKFGELCHREGQHFKEVQDKITAKGISL